MKIATAFSTLDTRRSGSGDPTLARRPLKSAERLTARPTLLSSVTSSVNLLFAIARFGAEAPGNALSYSPQGISR